MFRSVHHHNFLFHSLICVMQYSQSANTIYKFTLRFPSKVAINQFINIFIFDYDLCILCAYSLSFAISRLTKLINFSNLWRMSITLTADLFSFWTFFLLLCGCKFNVCQFHRILLWCQQKIQSTICNGYFKLRLLDFTYVYSDTKYYSLRTLTLESTKICSKAYLVKKKYDLQTIFLLCRKT